MRIGSDSDAYGARLTLVLWQVWHPHDLQAIFFLNIKRFILGEIGKVSFNDDDTQ